jgi:hypothetical protein
MVAAPARARVARAVSTVCAIALALPRAASGQPAEDSGAAQPDAEEQAKLTEAKELFRQGNALRAAGDIERALELYRRSRALTASVANTLNAALCLEQLGRYDESLELYQELVTRFGDQLGDEDRKAVGPAMEGLRKRLGKLEVSANVDGALLIDGRPRGRLPLASAVPVLPGDRQVRIFKDGYETFERTVAVTAGEPTRLDARLRPLSRIGRLRVEEPTLMGAELFVDGGMVGKLPWQGSLPPGRHVYFVRKGDMGSAPATAIVVEGQTVLVGVRARELGPELRVSVEPPSAELFIDGVMLGKGGWQGRLPTGRHAFEAREAGYLTASRQQEIGSDVGRSVSLRLRVDPSHPRWAKGSTGRPWIEAFGGPALGTSLDSDAEGDCADDGCAERDIPFGAAFGIRGGYEFRIGVSVELSGGYLSVGTELQRSRTEQFGRDGSVVDTTYDFTDRMRLAGPFAGAGLGFRRKVGGRFDAGGRLHAGLLVAASRDDIDAKASAGGRTIPAEVEGSGSVVRAPAFLLLPEVSMSAAVGPVHVGIGLGLAVFLLAGPKYEIGDTRVAGGPCEPTGPTLPVECAPRESLVAAERAHGQFVLWLPSVHVRYAF